MTKWKGLSRSPKEEKAPLSAGACQSKDVVREKEFRALFEDMFMRDSWKKIIPFASNPIVEVHPLFDSGVLQLTSLFENGYSNSNGICSISFMHGTDPPIVVELPGELVNLLVRH